MKKVFLYLYPIEEYARMFVFPKDFYKKKGIRYPFDVLNESIDKRYRKKDYEIVFALYPDKEMYGIEKLESDKLIYTDISFTENSGYYANGDIKPVEEIKYTDANKLLSQIDNIGELVVGGYHCFDCVYKVANEVYNAGIKTLIDLDMTELFFTLYRKDNYYQIENYDPKRYKNTIFNSEYFGKVEQKCFEERFSSPVYGIYNLEDKKKK